MHTATLPCHGSACHSMLPLAMALGITGRYKFQFMGIRLPTRSKAANLQAGCRCAQLLREQCACNECVSCRCSCGCPHEYCAFCQGRLIVKGGLHGMAHSLAMQYTCHAMYMPECICQGTARARLRCILLKRLLPMRCSLHWRACMRCCSERCRCRQGLGPPCMQI